LPAQLVWSPGEVSPPFTLVLLDSACTELLRRDGIGTNSWEVDAAARAVLGAGGIFHAYVVGDRCGRPAASPLARLEIVRSGTPVGIVR
jgi:hypothetical protein